MFSIFKRVKAVFENEYFHKSNDFKSGFRICFQLFEIGYERADRYNLDLQLHEQEKMLQKAKETKKHLQEANNRIHNYKIEVAVLKKELADRPVNNIEMDAANELKEELKLTLQKLADARKAIRYQDALIKEWNASNIDKMTPRFAKRMTVLRIAGLLNSPKSPDKQITELKAIFNGWNILPPEQEKKAS